MGSERQEHAEDRRQNGRKVALKRWLPYTELLAAMTAPTKVAQQATCLQHIQAARGHAHGACPRHLPALCRPCQRCKSCPRCSQPRPLSPPRRLSSETTLICAVLRSERLPPSRMPSPHASRSPARPFGESPCRSPRKLSMPRSARQQLLRGSLQLHPRLQAGPHQSMVSEAELHTGLSGLCRNCCSRRTHTALVAPCPAGGRRRRGLLPGAGGGAGPRGGVRHTAAGAARRRAPRQLSSKAAPAHMPTAEWRALHLD
jgi:hypothetical protein